MSSASTAAPVFQMSDLVRVVRERGTLIRTVAIATVALAVAAVMMLPTLYSTSASVMLDTRKNNVTELSAVLSQLPTDPSSLQNQIQILESRDLAAEVIGKLKLYEDPEFNHALKPGAMDAAFKVADPRNWFRGAVPADVSSERDKIIDAFSRGVSVATEGLSTTLTVAFTSRDPQKAALIANTLADTYIQDQIDAKRSIGGKTTAWLLNRTQQLAQQVQADEAAVQRYKAANNLNETADGTSFADQQITAISNQLVLAKADLAQKQATSDRVVALVKAGDTADVSQILASPLIVQLRTQQATLISQESELSTKYGPLHPKIAAIQTQKKDLQDKITTEVNRLAGSISNDVVVARAQVGSLQASLAQAEKQAGAQNMTRVDLKALEANAQSTRTLYEAFVTRLRETQDQDVIQNPDARVISRAPVPDAPSSPKRMLIVGASIPAGLLLGLLAALLAERFAAPMPVRAAPAAAFRTAPAPRRSGPPILAKLDNVFDPRAPDAVIDWPSSAFAQTTAALLQKLRAARRRPGAAVIAVTAPDRGVKTTVAVALARTASQAGLRVAVVDGDLQHPAVARAMRLGPSHFGLIELLTGVVPLANAFVRDPRSHASVIAAVQPRRDSAAILGSAKMAELIAYLRSNCDVVIVDAPPLFSSGEMHVLGRVCDAVVVIGRNEALMQGQAARAIATLSAARSALIGVVLAT
jgi:succinoglycan biosynthesis transport protein ExoP